MGKYSETATPSCNCDTELRNDCSKFEDATESRQCEKLAVYTLWGDWSACTPGCTSANDPDTKRTKTRTRECKDNNSECKDDELTESATCEVNVCQTCNAFANYCADRPNTQCVDVEENNVVK